MKKLRDYAIVLGLAGMILMVSADTKDVEATGKISYKSETLQEGLCMTAGIRTAEVSGEALTRLQAERASRAEEEERGRMARQAQEAAAAKERAAAEDSGVAETAEEAAAETGRIYEVSEEDYDALLRLVEAEASGEDIKGKLLVANVVLNRVKSGVFPDTIKEVIYQRQNGRAQFSPVATGKIDRVAVSEETVEAVERALCGEDESAGALYFVAPAYADAGNHQWFRDNLTLLFSYEGHEFYA